MNQATEKLVEEAPKGAEYFSPGRKPWVESKKIKPRKGRKNSAQGASPG